MIYMQTILDIADNSGARRASCISLVGASSKKCATIGDVIAANIIEASPDSNIKKGEVVLGVVVRTTSQIRRVDGSYLKFDSNAIVIIDKTKNPKGTRVFGPVARELREKKFIKIISLAPEVV